MIDFAEPAPISFDQPCQIVLGAEYASLWEMNQALIRLASRVLSHRRPIKHSSKQR
jgi:hypothetical protein